MRPGILAYVVQEAREALVALGEVARAVVDRIHDVHILAQRAGANKVGALEVLLLLRSLAHPVDRIRNELPGPRHPERDDGGAEEVAMLAMPIEDRRPADAERVIGGYAVLLVPYVAVLEPVLVPLVEVVRILVIELDLVYGFEVLHVRCVGTEHPRITI